MPRLLWTAVCLIAACGTSPSDPGASSEGAAAAKPDSSSWFKHAEDNAKFIERYNALYDSAGAPKDTDVIYTDTWTGHGIYNFSDSDSTSADTVKRK